MSNPVVLVTGGPDRHTVAPPRWHLPRSALVWLLTVAVRSRVRSSKSNCSGSARRPSSSGPDVRHEDEVSGLIDQAVARFGTPRRGGQHRRHRGAARPDRQPDCTELCRHV